MNWAVDGCRIIMRCHPSQCDNVFLGNANDRIVPLRLIYVHKKHGDVSLKKSKERLARLNLVIANLLEVGVIENIIPGAEALNAETDIEKLDKFFDAAFPKFVNKFKADDGNRVISSNDTKVSSFANIIYRMNKA